jgi:amino acid adenylation domain-containing protein
VNSVLHAIVDRALASPNHVAATDLERHVGYGQLLDEVARVGAGLRRRGVEEGDRVALFIPNSVDFVVAALACLWTGAIFVPLAVTDPSTRLASVVADCAPKVIVTSRDEVQLVPPVIEGSESVSLTTLDVEGSERVAAVDSASRGAYIIYTSGTTGTPKGVLIGTTAFAAAIEATLNAIGLDHATRTLCVSPFHFDGSYANLFPTLASGGTVVIRPREALLFPRTFFKTVANEGITYSGFTPSYLRLLLASPQISSLGDSTLKIIALGGESVFPADLRTLWTFAPALRVFNRYGPTETTIAVTNIELTSDLVDAGAIGIGRPHPGVSFVLLDEVGTAIEETNRTGELYIGGVQLMEGYWGAPALTREVMRSDVVKGETMYRTGDLVYRDDHGDYVYVDRADRVLKRNGVRVSLVELSESVGKIEGVVSAVCLAFDDDGQIGIVAFVVTDRPHTSVSLRRAAMQWIPENMLPNRFEVVAALPLNRSNQLDESRLLLEVGLRPSRINVSRPETTL